MRKKSCILRVYCGSFMIRGKTNKQEIKTKCTCQSCLLRLSRTRWRIFGTNRYSQLCYTHSRRCPPVAWWCFLFAGTWELLGGKIRYGSIDRIHTCVFTCMHVYMYIRAFLSDVHIHIHMQTYTREHKPYNVYFRAISTACWERLSARRPCRLDGKVQCAW